MKVDLQTQNTVWGKKSIWSSNSRERDNKVGSAQQVIIVLPFALAFATLPLFATSSLRIRGALPWTWCTQAFYKLEQNCYIKRQQTHNGIYALLCKALTLDFSAICFQYNKNVRHQTCLYVVEHFLK